MSRSGTSTLIWRMPWSTYSERNGSWRGRTTGDVHRLRQPLVDVVRGLMDDPGTLATRPVKLPVRHVVDFGRMSARNRHPPQWAQLLRQDRSDVEALLGDERTQGADD
jgi:hypothetical protein